jgi:hypothetical protein
MSEAELNALERDVELTRAKFAHDLGRLRSPHNLAEFKEDLWAHARETKDGMVADLKARAAANPAALESHSEDRQWLRNPRSWMISFTILSKTSISPKRKF